MIPCPSCHQQVEVTEQNYGTLYTCPHCNAVYFVGWDGQFEINSPESDSSPLEETVIRDGTVDSGFIPPISDFSAEPDFQNQNTYESESDFQSSDSVVSPEAEAPYEAEESFVGGDSYGTEVPTASSYDDNVVAMPAQDAYTTAEPTETEAPYDFTRGLSEQVVTESMTPDTADFSDVESFANADTSAGTLAYTLVIEGIETNSLVKQLREAMSDSKFGWDVDALLNQVGGGRLILRQVSPTKASVLINRIKYLPFKISWRQDVFAGS